MLFKYTTNTLMTIKWFIILLSFSTQISRGFAFFDGLYCGRDNCYDILGVTRQSPRDEISREYRKLARKWHPDVHKGEEAKQIATEKFRQLANAYEVLREEESRRDYDYMLDNPDEMYAHYYRYYRRMYTPKVDVRIVIVVTITVISGFQYYAMHSRFKEAIDYFLTVPKYRLKAQEIAKTDGLIDNSAANRKKNRFRNKDDIKIEEENILRKIIEEKMDIKGGYQKPSYKNVLWIQLIFLPYTITMYLIWYFRWIWKFTINKEELGDEEKKYIIRKYMSLSQLQWEALSDDEIEEYMIDELWMKDKFDVWKKNKDDETKAQMAESSSYKRYRRYMRKGGPGQMTFLDD
ncbi:dnaJ homolog subfamily C member 25 homolog [Oppia nitens]|uniref:dnaJ homolog subfamily C member 25 homolog n=1 Tax=Oppia nitens TaxID=1686743 RepID=UPI0023DA482A|nr:dnaJ homolog subfamily C member 25 homolog [Oppia nitens]